MVTTIVFVVLMAMAPFGGYWTRCTANICQLLYFPWRSPGWRFWRGPSARC